MTSKRFNDCRRLSRNPGVFGSHCIYIAGSKVKAFDTLFAAIQKERGSELKALEFVGISHSTLTRMREGKLSEMVAKRIMSAYKNLQKLKA